MNRKGFTLVELLAMLVVLGILMAVTIPNITGILNQSKTNIIKDDVAKMVDTAKMKIASDEDIKNPKTGKCIAFTLNALDKNDDFKSGANGGKYDKFNSYVIVKRENNEYKYYVTLIEEVDGNYYGVDNVDFTDFEKDGDSLIGDISDYSSRKLNSSSTLSIAKTDSSITKKCPSTKMTAFYN